MFSENGIIPIASKAGVLKWGSPAALPMLAAHSRAHPLLIPCCGTGIYFLGMKSLTQPGMCHGGAQARPSMQGEFEALSSCGGAETP